MSLRSYVLRTVGTYVLGAAAILLALLQILDLLDVTTDILDRGLGFGGVLYYAALRFPRLIEQVAVLCVLSGGLIAFSKLARESAVIAMRASGISAYRMLWMAAPVALCVAVVDFVAVELVAPRTDPVLQAWWRDTAPPAEAKVVAEPRPFRVGPDLAVTSLADTSGRRLDHIRIYRRDVQGHLSERIEAASASYGPTGWTLHAPQIVRFGGPQPEISSAAAMEWPVTLKPRDVQALFAAAPMPTGASARRALTGGASERPKSYYEVRLQRVVTGPLSVFVMLLLAAPAALGNFRNSQGAALLAGGLGAGLLFLVADGMLSALGESGALSPILAAWTAPLIFAALGVTALLKLEG